MGEQRDIKPNTFVCLALAVRGQGFEAWPGISISPSVTGAEHWVPIQQMQKDLEGQEGANSSQMSSLPPIFSTFPLCFSTYLSLRLTLQSAQTLRSQEYNANS